MSTSARRGVLVAVVGLTTVASLALLGWQWLAGPPAVVSGGTATLGSLTVEVRDASWVDFDMNHVMDGQGGFVMPDQMMPGAPRGDEVRLGVTLTLANTDARAHGFNVAEEFSLVGGAEPEPRPLSADTIGVLPRLGPGAAVDGVLYFDVAVPADDDPPQFLLWRRGDDRVRIPLPLAGVAPTHEHG